MRCSLDKHMQPCTAGAPTPAWRADRHVRGYCLASSHCRGTFHARYHVTVSRQQTHSLAGQLHAQHLVKGAGPAGRRLPSKMQQALLGGITGSAAADHAAPAAQVPDPLIAGYFGAVSVAEAPRAAGAAACKALDLGAVPLVLLARDWTGLWHFLTVQLLAAHRALRALSLDPRRPFRLLFADRPGTCPSLLLACLKCALSHHPVVMPVG